MKTYQYDCNFEIVLDGYNVTASEMDSPFYVEKDSENEDTLCIETSEEAPVLMYGEMRFEPDEFIGTTPPHLPKRP